MHNPQEILKQILRIADFAIVSLPNFAYYKNRLYLLFKGEMPVRKTIPYQWYNTPNIHFCSINDFSKLCQNMGFAIENTLYLKQNGKLLTSKILPNLLAEFGLFVISKNTTNLVTESNFVFAKYAKANLSTG
jgi:methionine biosynthesis protein MetW